MTQRVQANMGTHFPRTHHRNPHKQIQDLLIQKHNSQHKQMQTHTNEQNTKHKQHRVTLTHTKCEYYWGQICGGTLKSYKNSF